MTVSALPSVRWSTTAFSGRDVGSTGDMSLLGAHYARCNGCKGRWFSIRCAIDAIDAFVAPRFVTTLFVIGAVIGVGSLVV